MEEFRIQVVVKDRFVALSPRLPLPVTTPTLVVFVQDIFSELPRPRAFVILYSAVRNSPTSITISPTDRSLSGKRGKRFVLLFDHLVLGSVH